MRDEYAEGLRYSGSTFCRGGSGLTAPGAERVTASGRVGANEELERGIALGAALAKRDCAGGAAPRSTAERAVAYACARSRPALPFGGGTMI